MTTEVLITILAASLVGLAVIVVLIIRAGKHPKAADPKKAGAETKQRKEYKEMTDHVDHIFNDEFREELRNHGRLYFDKIIGENAMFLQQDLRLTSSQLNEYMKKEISVKLQEAFGSYEQSMKDAQATALESIQQTIRAAELQREALLKQTDELVAAEKDRQIKYFEEHMGDIINHYLAEAFGNQLNLADQTGYILGEMEANKEAMKKDMQA